MKVTEEMRHRAALAVARADEERNNARGGAPLELWAEPWARDWYVWVADAALDSVENEKRWWQRWWQS